MHCFLAKIKIKLETRRNIFSLSFSTVQNRSLNSDNLCRGLIETCLPKTQYELLHRKSLFVRGLDKGYLTNFSKTMLLQYKSFSEWHSSWTEKTVCLGIHVTHKFYYFSSICSRWLVDKTRLMAWCLSTSADFAFFHFDLERGYLNFSIKLNALIGENQREKRIVFAISRLLASRESGNFFSCLHCEMDRLMTFQSKETKG